MTSDFLTKNLHTLTPVGSMAERKSIELEFAEILDREIDSQRDLATRGSLTEAHKDRELSIRSPHEVGASQNTLTMPNTETLVDDSHRQLSTMEIEAIAIENLGG